MGLDKVLRVPNAPKGTRFGVGRGLGVLLHGTIVEDHPGGAKLISKHAETGGEEGLLHWHKDLATVGE